MADNRPHILTTGIDVQLSKMIQKPTHIPKSNGFSFLFFHIHAGANPGGGGALKLKKI